MKNNFVKLTIMGLSVILILLIAFSQIEIIRVRSTLKSYLRSSTLTEFEIYEKPIFDNTQFIIVKGRLDDEREPTYFFMVDNDSLFHKYDVLRGATHKGFFDISSKVTQKDFELYFIVSGVNDGYSKITVKDKTTDKIIEIDTKDKEVVFYSWIPTGSTDPRDYVIEKT